MRLPIPTWFIVFLVLPACSFQASCGGIDTDKIKKSVSETLSKEGLTVTSVTCPDKIKVESGSSFDCTAKVKDIEFEPTFRFVQQDDKGNVNWNMIDALVTKKFASELQVAVKEKTKIDVEVTCGGPPLQQVAKGRKLECTATKDGQSKTVAVTFTSDEGGYSWELK